MNKPMLIFSTCALALIVFCAVKWEDQIPFPESDEKLVHCVSNFPISEESFTGFLKERGYDAKVVLVDFKEYADWIKVKKGKFHRFLRAIHLDLPHRVTVPKNVDKIVFFNIPPRQEKKCDLSKLPKEKMIAFLWEPPSVISRLYDPSFQQCFSKIFTWDDDLVDEKRFFKFNYPTLQGMKEEIPSFEEKKLCTIVCSNLKSQHTSALYPERIKAITYFDEAGEEGFDLYGKGWAFSEFKNYRGTVGDKGETIKNYRFYICFENIKDVKGYVTEKIFDCFAAGTVPIYWGASNIEDIIPKGCYVDFREFSSYQELHAFIKAMSKEEYEEYLSNIRAFLNSTAAQKFSWKQLGDAFYSGVSL